ncbi:transmembrane protein, putative, partial [Rhizoctonia solani AG-3 Rhs1AP]
MSNLMEVAVWDLYLTRYLTYAALTILLYDHVATISDEIFLIWPAKMGLLKLVFLFNRYSVPLVIAFSCFVLSGQASFLNKQVDNASLNPYGTGTNNDYLRHALMI